MALPEDYLERVYAGVLGKLIGVYLGRPFEGWTYERITSELGEVDYYVHERLGKPLIVTDDDLSGTFTFLRALPDHANSSGITPAQIGETWLNYIVENRTILWWGGLGHSTEHTAYLRLKAGIPAPRSGSIALNGKTVAEQIGAQIFIDGWGMVVPGDPERAADLACRAASVSHDGEAVYGAQVLAAMEALAFVEPDRDRLLDAALALIPANSVLYRMAQDLRDWHATEPDWHKTRQKIAEIYGYGKYPGNVHIIPNHALILLGFLYGEDDFQRSLMIVNTAGWDTDCNSGNLGCLLGIKNGLAGIDGGPDWRGPVADRLYLSTADGGRAITDAVSEAVHVANAGRALAGEPPLRLKEGARFHFELPGSVQSFRVKSGSGGAQGSIENVRGHSRTGERSLAIGFQRLEPGTPLRIATPTFIPPEDLGMPGYALLASPALYPGQVVRASISAGEGNPHPVTCRLYLSAYTAGGDLAQATGPEAVLSPGDAVTLTWTVPGKGSEPIAEIGLEVESGLPTRGVVYLDSMTWDGAPQTVFSRPNPAGPVWTRAWVDGVDHFFILAAEPFRIIQDHGRGLLSQGTRDWQDYRASTTVWSHLMASGGLAVRVQGMRRYYALLLSSTGRVRLVKAVHDETVLGETEFTWEPGREYTLSLQARGNQLKAWLDGELVFDLVDPEPGLEGGGLALVCEEGCLSAGDIHVEKAPEEEYE